MREGGRNIKGFSVILFLPCQSVTAGWRISTRFPHYRDLPGWFPGSVVRLGYSFVFMLVVLFVGVVIFNRIEKIYIDTV